MAIRRGFVVGIAASVALAAQVRAASVGTVFVIAMENHDFTADSSTAPNTAQQLLGNPAAPYLNSLITPGNANAAQVSYASNYLNAGVGDHPSEPNYVWAEAGTDFGVHTDNDPGTYPTTSTPFNSYTAPHLTGLMNAAGVSWNNYQEDVQLSTSPLHSASGTSATTINPFYGTGQYNYAAKHNPMAFFTDTATQNVKTFSSLQSDIAADTVSVSHSTATDNFGQYNWITPNQYNDMHSALTGGFTYHGVSYTGDQAAVATGDNFLATIIPELEATQAYQNNGAIVIWFDESEGGDTPGQTIPEIVISPLAKGNAYDSTELLNHSSDIKTMQEIFGLGPTYLNNPIPSSEVAPGSGSSGPYNSVTSVNDLSDLFQTGVIPSGIPVPEPASLAMLGMGALVLVRRRR
ncbi:MAG TPA: alkaline phosphatase family protein [Phycisphaerae bacterium]|nr:alkaline phosphatase family protein [Phycisphaerae bacterium]